MPDVNLRFQFLQPQHRHRLWHRGVLTASIGLSPRLLTHNPPHNLVVQNRPGFYQCGRSPPTSQNQIAGFLAPLPGRNTLMSERPPSPSQGPTRAAPRFVLPSRCCLWLPASHRLSLSSSVPGSIRRSPLPGGWPYALTWTCFINCVNYDGRNG